MQFAVLKQRSQISTESFLRSRRLSSQSVERTFEFELDGVHLYAYDFGDEEPSVVLLRGLTGYAGD